MKQVDTVLTIAGSDSSGGAGIQADLKTFSAHDLFGTSVITSITAQNSKGVQSAHDLPPEVVEAQLRAILTDAKPLAVKTGMLGNERVVECVVRLLKRARVKNLVVDPVIRSSSGKVLLSKKGVDALKEKLLPLALLVTPNLKEAEILSGIKIKGGSDRLKAARAIKKFGVKNVLIKGGHLKGNPDDFFFNGRKTVVLKAERLSREDLHGTGCVLSAAIAARLAKGNSLMQAVEGAKEFISSAILGGVRVGNNSAYVEPMSQLSQSRQRLDLFQRLSQSVEILKENRIGELVPEVQTNIGQALPNAKEWNDVIAFPGRVIKKGKDIVTLAPPAFGGSKHIAKVILAAMRHDPSKQAAMNIKFTDSLLGICKKLKFKIGSFNRSKEPKNVKQLEGSSLEWGTDKAIRDCGYVPDIIFDRGGQGKEEMIRVIADDIESLTEKVLKIHRLAEKNSGKRREKDKWRTA